MEGIKEQKTWIKYVNSDTSVNAGILTLVEGSQNVLITGSDINMQSVETRPGYVLYGGAGTTTQPIVSEYHKFANPTGTIIPIRTYFDPVISDVQHIEIYFDQKWHNVSAVSGIHEIYFTEWWDDVSKKNYLVYVNGKQINYWGGEVVSIDTTTVNSITVKQDIVLSGFATPSGSLTINNSTYTYTGITGKTFTGVSPDPSSLTNGTTVIKFASFVSNSVPRSGCKVLNVNFDICSSLNNHVIFGNYGQKSLYIANSFYSKQNTPSIYSTNLAFNDIEITGTSNLTCSLNGSNTKKLKIVFNEGYAPIDQDYYVNSSITPLEFDANGHISTNTIDEYVVKIVNITTSPDLIFFEAYLNGSLIIASSVFAGSTVTLPNNVLMVFSSDLITDYQVGTTSTLRIRGNDKYSWYVDNGSGYVLQASGVDTTVPLVVDGITYKFLSLKGHSRGEFIEYEIQPDFSGGGNVLSFTDFFYSLPARKPGEGYIATLDSAPIAFIQQEKFMYVNGQGGEWYQVSLDLSDDGKYERVVIERIKTSKMNKVLRMANMAHTRNDVVFISQDKSIDSIGRVVSIDMTPQTTPLQNDIRKDVKNGAWYVNKNGELNGRMIGYDDKIFITDPSMGKIYIYDLIKQAWQPPITGYPVSCFAIIDGILCGHSSVANETYRLFTGTNDNGNAIIADMRMSYNNFGMFSEYKNAQKLFTAGFKNTSSNLYTKLLFGYAGCNGIVEKRIDPIMCLSPIDTSHGKARLGQHGLANDKVVNYEWFEHMTHFNPTKFYQMSIGYYDHSIDGYFKIVATGIDASIKNAINSQQISQSAGTQEPEDVLGVPNTDIISTYINQPITTTTIDYDTIYTDVPWSGGQDDPSSGNDGGGVGVGGGQDF